MRHLRFTWDRQKDVANLKKHRVGFAEAQTVFFDDRAVEFYDPGHSGREDRFILLGLSLDIRVLVVCYCFQHRESVIRIISARKAPKREEKVYNGGGE